jgi:hypothetical protein
MPSVHRSVSVVIPTRNRTSILTETLQAVFDAAPHAKETFEVLVVDDGDGGALGAAGGVADNPPRVLRYPGTAARRRLSTSSWCFSTTTSSSTPGASRDTSILRCASHTLWSAVWLDPMNA